MLGLLFGPFGVLIESLLPTNVEAKRFADSARVQAQNEEQMRRQAEFEKALRDYEREWKQQQAELERQRAEREEWYRARGVEPGPFAWFYVLPDWLRAVLVGLAIASIIGSLFFIALNTYLSPRHELTQPVVATGQASAASTPGAAKSGVALTRPTPPGESPGPQFEPTVPFRPISDFTVPPGGNDRHKRNPEVQHAVYLSWSKANTSSLKRADQDPGDSHLRTYRASMEPRVTLILKLNRLMPADLEAIVRRGYAENWPMPDIDRKYASRVFEALDHGRGSDDDDFRLTRDIESGSEDRPSHSHPD
jgi:hypothetical protein